MTNLFLMKALKITLIFQICLFPLLLTGCWDRIEINDLGLVLATGLDLTDDGELELSVQLAIPMAMGAGQGTSGGQGGEGQATTVEKVTGRTIFDAISKLQASVSRRIFWGHNQVIIIGEELAKDGIQKHMEFFVRHPAPRLRTYIFVSKGKATDILKVVPDFDNTSAEVAREIAKFQVGMSVTLKELLQMLSEKASGAVLPLIEPEKEEQGKGGLKVNGTAVFKKDKMIAQIDAKVTRGILWLRDDIQLGAIILDPKEAEGHISFDLIRSRTELLPKIENDHWKMIVRITTEEDTVENETNLNLMNPEIVARLEKQLEQKIEERIRLTLEQVQKELKVDIFGFAEAFRRKYPRQWAKVENQWDEKFSELDVVIDTKAYIRRPGMSTTPQGMPEEEVQQE
ncbi:Ger(x)C family spore germination protein [Bacillus sp. B15-48]|uniref:Ger(x)C family spore germination protein n=1 Tax=Bacillus sp. B15-48 TaxID=1548601 RepID=UPI00193F2DD6|nr:Ger(x)C family spore germination protein [Bacillus sp. B15-48]MBM4761100.1 Ger(x)C family spore germination protein [Bacillus sp. B15-48]